MERQPFLFDMMLTVIITAGGIGKRMGGDLPKQFLRLGDKTILQHSVEAFYRFDPQAQLLITLPESWASYWKDLCEKECFEIPHQLIVGGQERFHSIQEALKFAKGDLVAVHDGVRPLVSQETISRTFHAAKKSGAAVPTIPVTDSLRKYVGEHNRAVNRKEYVLVQTPQIFESELLRRAYAQEYHEGITDDASLVEALGEKIMLVNGNEENMKVTTVLDLKVANLFLRDEL